jgi:hypothetical protein
MQYDIIELKPKIENHFTCPECKSVNTSVREVLIEPIYELADCTCLDCGLEFYQTLRAGHSINDRLSIEKLSKKIYLSHDSPSWLSDILLHRYDNTGNNKVNIEKKVFNEYKDVVILNALDFLYGHVLLKLYNAQYHLDHQKELGLIVIIPKIFEWLIPQGCAEAWIVDLRLSELAYGNISIQRFVSHEFQRFNNIYLSKAYSHPDFTKVDISRLTGIKPFELKYFDEVRPTITFVLREDRWWYSSILDYWFYRLCRKLKILSWGSRILAWQQNRLVKKTIDQIRKNLPEADIAVVGLGKTGTFTKSATDYRATAVDQNIEITWCKQYAKSHVVVGVHGSNMLLPTAHAAGCIEILPADRYSNMVQDISVRYNDRKQLFFYRFVDQYANPKSVSEKIVAIIRDFNEYNKNMCTNLYKRNCLQ